MPLCKIGLNFSKVFAESIFLVRLCEREVMITASLKHFFALYTQPSVSDPDPNTITEVLGWRMSCILLVRNVEVLTDWVQTRQLKSETRTHKICHTVVEVNKLLRNSLLWGYVLPVLFFQTDWGGGGGALHRTRCVSHIFFRWFFKVPSWRVVGV